MKISDINPDAAISVACVYPDGTVAIYEPLYAGQTARQCTYSRTFPTYGAAKLFAQEYEEQQREMLKRRQH